MSCEDKEKSDKPEEATIKENSCETVRLNNANSNEIFICNKCLAQFPYRYFINTKCSCGGIIEIYQKFTSTNAVPENINICVPPPRTKEEQLKIDLLLSYLIGEDFIKGKEFIEPMALRHGRCCICKDCGQGNDDCVCAHNERIKKLKGILGIKILDF